MAPDNTFLGDPEIQRPEEREELRDVDRSAIVMMLIAMAVLWGGLALAIWNINRYQGEEPEEVQREL